jgi:hypothetical protein
MVVFTQHINLRKTSKSLTFNSAARVKEGRVKENKRAKVIVFEGPPGGGTGSNLFKFKKRKVVNS